MDGGTFLVLIIAGLIYFIPALNAASRKHNSGAAITAANLFFGWTRSVGHWLRGGWPVAVGYVLGFMVMLVLLGWLLCLVWSYSGNRKTVEAGAPSPETHVRCPECRELVIHDARKCKHCGCALIPQ